VLVGSGFVEAGDTDSVVEEELGVDRITWVVPASHAARRTTTGISTAATARLPIALVKRNPAPQSDHTMSRLRPLTLGGEIHTAPGQYLLESCSLLGRMRKPTWIDIDTAGGTQRDERAVVGELVGQLMLS
jgi:hypothetical protein